MLQMPPIQRRDIERLKGTRAIKIERAAPVDGVSRDHPEPKADERRVTLERRKQDAPVANDRRRKGRRYSRQPLNPKIRALLDNAETRPLPNPGRFVDESV